MSRFSEHEVEGYNKAVILKAGLKPGSKIKVGRDTVWVVKIYDDCITVDYHNEEGKFPVPLRYDVIGSLEGVAAETISLCSQDEFKYGELEERYEREVQQLTAKGGEMLELDDVPVIPRSAVPVLLELKHGRIEQYLKRRDYHKSMPYGFLCVVEASTAEGHLTISDDALLYDLFRNSLADIPFFTSFTIPSSKSISSIHKGDVRAIYSLESLEAFAPLVTALEQKAAAARALINNATPDTTSTEPVALPVLTVAPYAVPYAITTRPDGFLPDMTDFTLERVGSVTEGWYSTVPIKAGRDLAGAEKLSAFLVNRRSGEITRFAYTAQAGKLTADKWPQAFAGHIAAAGSGITAGAWSTDNTFSTASTPLRLWSHAQYRAFTNAPFAGNLVQALACNDSFQLAAQHTLCLQVRDLKTQALFEQHFFTPTTEQAGTNWTKALCQQINRDSDLLRAGVVNSQCQVTPADNGNAFWVPQCAEVSVTLTAARWWESRKVEGNLPLAAGKALHAWVYDAFSHRLLAHHEWRPGSAQRASGQWLAAWASALNGSEVAPYLRAGASSPTASNLAVTDATGLGLWHRGDALRIFTSLPDDPGTQGLALELPTSATTADALQLTISHPFSGQVLHRARFTPAQAEGATALALSAWRTQLARFVQDQHWPELGAELRLPAFSELQVDISAVDEDEPSADEAQAAQTTPAFQVASAIGSLEVTLPSLDGQVVFRMAAAARNKGVRIAACVPTDADKEVPWPVSVTDSTITWIGPDQECKYKISLDYPVNVRGQDEQALGHIGTFDETQFWHNSVEVKFTPSAALTPYKPISLLCEDYGNTERSEIFDTLGQTETGVDPRTGLFHAHYPVATLQGLSGLGPLCDLTLHYSALRGNEAGLGDGWAWRFSSLDVRDRTLTLANGVRIAFTPEQWQALGKGEPFKHEHCHVQSDRNYSEFTLDLPSGRREVLRKPAAAGGDEVEPNDKFRQKVIQALNAIKEKSKPKFPAMPEHWTQWVLLVLSPGAYYIGAKLDYDEAYSAWEKHGSVKELDERIAYYQRPFVQLLPARIESRYGEALDLTWKRRKGQFLLLDINSGEQVLFSAQYPTPATTEAQANQQVRPGSEEGDEVTLQVWPDSEEGYEVKLQLQHQLLRTLTRKKAAVTLQQVECGYADDPTLDRVLCRLEELDGSVEYVQYSHKKRSGNERPVWPEAELHVLIPGSGQENQLSTYRYNGRLLDTADQLYIVAGERGVHGTREHHLQVFGLDAKAQRQEIVAGAASAQSQWLEFKLQASNTTQVLRYTGYGDALLALMDSIKVVIKASEPNLTFDGQVKHAQAIVEMLWHYRSADRRRLHKFIQALLKVVPAEQRKLLGKAVDRVITETDSHGLVSKIITEGQHTLYRAYYPREGGDNIVKAVDLNALEGVSGVPQLNCPALPAYAAQPLMAEYQCDSFGNALGLKLFGYETVARAGRQYLELAQQQVLEGVAVEGNFDGTLTATTPWKKATDQQVVWRRASHVVSPVTAKQTQSGESKVKEWTITDTKQTYLGTDVFELISSQVFEDNPTVPHIIVRSYSQAEAGKQWVSTELRSSYSSRVLERAEGTVQTTWAYDAAGRVVDEAHYRLQAGSKKRTKKQRADARVTSQYATDGKWVTRQQANGDKQRDYLDGLQRIWRGEGQRAGASGYVPLSERYMEGLGESQADERFEWDYLPGGQAVLAWVQAELEEGSEPWSIEQGSMVDDDKIAPEYRQVKLTYQNHNRIDKELDLLFSNLYQLPGNTYDEKVGDLIEEILSETRSLFPSRGFDFGRVAGFLYKLSGRTGEVEQNIYFNHEITVLNSGVPRVERLYSLINKSLEGDTSSWGRLEVMDFFELVGYGKVVKYLSCSESALPTSSNATDDVLTRSVRETGLAQQRLLEHTTAYLTKKDGTFERTETLANGAGEEQMKRIQRLDANGRVTRSERVVGTESRAYTFERDTLGRVTNLTRPDATSVEWSYHGFSNQPTEIKVGGKVVATQTVTHASTLQSRTVGNRTYTFGNDDEVTLPDKTRLRTTVTDSQAQWHAGDSTLGSLKHKDNEVTLASSDSEGGRFSHSFSQGSLPGRERGTHTTAHSQAHSSDWKTLRGTTVASQRADGHMQRGFVDHDGRLLRSCQDHEDVAYRYDAFGQLQSRQVQAVKAGEQWQVLSAHDGLGREVSRTFLHNGAARFNQRMTWRGDGRLASKASYQDGVLRSTEGFTYDALDRLQGYTCDCKEAAHCPKGASGKPIKAQRFAWDALDNLVSCVTTHFDGTAQTRTYTYGETQDPTRMTAVQQGSASADLAWSTNGFLLEDGSERKFAYTASGQVNTVSDANDQLLSRYHYDGYQRLAAQYIEQDQSTRELRYDGDQLIGEIWFDKDRAVTRRTSISAGLAEYDGEQVRWLIDDPQVGVAGQVKEGEWSLAPLLPFGEGAALDNVVSGYNGMRRDPVTGQYHAGNGYRSYDPTLCRYAQPDWLAPVGEGGYNPYQHCPDPVNQHDPSGAIMLSRWGQNRVLQDLDKELQETQSMQVGGKWRGLAMSLLLTVLGVVATVFSGGTASMLLFAVLTTLSVVSFGLEVASVLTAESNPELSKALGIASMATGILSAACFMGVVKAGFSVIKGAISLAGRTARAVGRGFKAAWRYATKGALVRQSMRLSVKQSLAAFRARIVPGFNKFVANKMNFNFIDASPEALKPMPSYEQFGWIGKLKSLWEGPDPLKLLSKGGMPAKLYMYANRSRFVSTMFELEALAIEANVLRGTVESSISLAQGDESATISPRARGRYRADVAYEPQNVRPRFDLWKALGLST